MQYELIVLTNYLHERKTGLCMYMLALLSERKLNVYVSICTGDIHPFILKEYFVVFLQNVTFIVITDFSKFFVF